MKLITYNPTKNSAVGKHTPEYWMNLLWSTHKYLSEECWNGYKMWTEAYKLHKRSGWGNDTHSKTSNTEDLGNKVTVPYIASHLRNLIPFLVYKDPSFLGTPININDTESVKSQLYFLNAIWRTGRFNSEIKRAAYDSGIIGHCITKTRYRTTEQNQHEFSVNRVNPFFFLMDPTTPTKRMEDCMWVSEIIPRTLQEIISDDDVDEVLKSKIKDQSLRLQSIAELVHTWFERDTDTEYDGYEAERKHSLYGENAPLADVGKKTISNSTVAVYEIWDRINGRYFELVLTDDGPKFLKERSEWPHNQNRTLKAFPYAMSNFIEMPNELYGVGTVYFLTDSQKLLERIHSRLYAYFREDPKQLIYTGEEPLEEKEQRKVIDQIANAVVNVPSGGRLDKMPAHEITSAELTTLQLLQEDFRTFSGEDALSQGASLPSRTSAREVQARLNVRQLKLEDSADGLRDMLLVLGNNILALAKEVVKTDQVVNLIGYRGANFQPKTVSQEDFRVSFDLFLGVVSKPIKSEEEERNELIQIMNLIANPSILQLFQASQIPINIKGIFDRIVELSGIDTLTLQFGDQFVIPENYVFTNNGQPPVPSGQPPSEAPVSTPNPDNPLNGLLASLGQSPTGTQ